MSISRVAKNAENELALELVGGIEWVAESVASGLSLTEVAAKAQVSYFWLYRWVAAAPQRMAILKAAREAAAHVKVVEAEKIADRLTGVGLMGPGGAAEVAAAKLRAELRWKLAGKLDPDTYADKKSEGNTLNINHLHLEAVRAVNAAPPPRALPAGVTDEPDFETIPVQEVGTAEAQVVDEQALSEDGSLPEQQG